MGKQKYPTAVGSETADGQKTHRDNSKKGIKAGRRENRRLEAMARQVVNIQNLEKALEKSKDKEAAQAKLTQALLTLQKIRGGVPHNQLDKKVVAEPTT